MRTPSRPHATSYFRDPPCSSFRYFEVTERGAGQPAGAGHRNARPVCGTCAAAAAGGAGVHPSGGRTHAPSTLSAEMASTSNLAASRAGILACRLASVPCEEEGLRRRSVKRFGGASDPSALLGDPGDALTLALSRNKQLGSGEPQLQSQKRAETQEVRARQRGRHRPHTPPPVRPLGALHGAHLAERAELAAEDDHQLGAAAGLESGDVRLAAARQLEGLGGHLGAGGDTADGRHGEKGEGGLGVVIDFDRRAGGGNAGGLDRARYKVAAQRCTSQPGLG